MATLHEQARAEAEKRWPEPRSLTRGGMVVGFEEGATWAATRTRVVTTVTELDALPIGSVVLSEQGAVFERDHDGFWAEPGFTWHPMSKDMALPARVLYNPEEDA